MVWQVSEDELLNPPDGSKPIAFELQTNSNNDVGNFTYTMKIRANKVNLYYVYWETTIEIEI